MSDTSAKYFQLRCEFLHHKFPNNEIGKYNFTRYNCVGKLTGVFLFIYKLFITTFHAFYVLAHYHISKERKQVTYL